MNTVRCFWCMCQELLCECCLPCARVVWVVLRVGSCCHSVPLLSLKRLVMLMDLKMMCVALITASATATQIHNPIAKMRRKKMHTGYDIDRMIGSDAAPSGCL